MIVQVLPFSSPMIGVLVSRVMSSYGEGIYTPTSSILDGGVPPPLIGTLIPSESTTPLSPSSQVDQPLTPSNVVDPFSGVVTSILSASFPSSSFMQTA